MWQCGVVVLCLKLETAYEMRISDGSSDVCSSDLGCAPVNWQGRVGWGSLRRSVHASRPGQACRRGHPAASTWALLLIDLPEKGEKAIGYGFAQGFVVDLAQVGADPVLLAAVDLLGRGRRAQVGRRAAFIVCHHFSSPGCNYSYYILLSSWNPTPLRHFIRSQ